MMKMKMKFNKIKNVTFFFHSPFSLITLFPFTYSFVICEKIS